MVSRSSSVEMPLRYGPYVAKYVASKIWVCNGTWCAMDPFTRFCTKCQHVKSERDFYKTSYQCKECKKASTKEHSQRKTRSLQGTVDSLELLVYDLVRRVE